ncbi:MAG: DUF4296 domain-containing protein [Chitinophagaceae bacterium]|nr:MAG: DUF4296 domain-containing protein [Chitinophagaceae bacterium]
MMRWIPIAALFLLGACAHNERLPDDVLPPARMAPVLKGVIAADEYVGMQQEQGPLADPNAERIHRYRAAFRDAGVSEAEFRRSFTYYKAHPALLRSLFDTLQRQPNIDSTAAPAGLRRKGRPATPGNVQ